MLKHLQVSVFYLSLLLNVQLRIAEAVRAKKLDLVRFLGTSAKISKYVADIIIRNIGYMHIMPN